MGERTSADQYMPGWERRCSIRPSAGMPVKRSGPSKLKSYGLKTYLAAFYPEVRSEGQ